MGKIKKFFENSNSIWKKIIIPTIEKRDTY